MRINAHDPEKWEPVFGYNHAQKEISMADFLGMMKQAAQLQSKMQAMQAELDTITVEGTAGGGMVTVTLTAKGDLKSVKLDDSLMKPSEKEIIEDLLVAAHADARRKAETVLAEKMKAVTGGMQLPPGLGLG
jgi:DNA-binding YbaB/EbfC family protein